MPGTRPTSTYRLHANITIRFYVYTGIYHLIRFSNTIFYAFHISSHFNLPEILYIVCLNLIYTIRMWFLLSPKVTFWIFSIQNCGNLKETNFSSENQVLMCLGSNSAFFRYIYNSAIDFCQLKEILNLF